MQQIIAMGGGGNAILDLYILKQARVPRPRVSFLPQANAESPPGIVGFFSTFSQYDCIPSFLSLFSPHTADIEGYLMEQDVIYVGGGNTRSMLAVWREWGLHDILRKAADNGTVLAGISAGGNCWFEQCTTTSTPGEISVLKCLGYVRGSFCPHYNTDAQRRPMLHRFVSEDRILDGYAFEDGAGGHFIDGTLHAAIAAEPNAKGYHVRNVAGEAVETPLSMTYLL